MLLEDHTILIPADVPEDKKGIYVTHYREATKNTGKLVLFAGDQKVEHLNNDFYGENISPEDNNPEHLFQIAASSNIGVFAAQLGLIARYGQDYSTIPYLIKLNSKSNIVKPEEHDPLSESWFAFGQVQEFMTSSQLNIVGVGYTIYLGSEYETEMLKEAAQIILRAHQQGLLTVIWMYPRGKNITDEKDAHLIAGAAGVAASLGADFVKVNYPHATDIPAEELFKEAVQAAGRTKVICAGGPSEDPQAFFETLYKQLHISGAAGCATGRNIHQKPLDEANRFCHAISSLVYDNKTVEEALAIYNQSHD
jgi:DhnA family fructose-bisphosphate aldolase class Ia